MFYILGSIAFIFIVWLLYWAISLEFSTFHPNSTIRKFLPFLYYHQGTRNSVVDTLLKGLLKTLVTNIKLGEYYNCIEFGDNNIIYWSANKYYAYMKNGSIKINGQEYTIANYKPKFSILQDICELEKQAALHIINK